MNEDERAMCVFVLKCQDQPCRFSAGVCEHIFSDLLWKCDEAANQSGRGQEPVWGSKVAATL